MIDAANTIYFTALILVSLRLVAFFIIVPVFFPEGTPDIVKVSLSLMIAYIIMPGISTANLANVNTMMTFVIYAINEVIAGLTLGFFTNLCFMSARFAGSVMDLQVGFSMLSMYDPSTSSNTTLIEHMLYWFSLVLFFIIDGHHMLIRALIDSFSNIQIGQFFLSNANIKVILNAFTAYFAVGIKIAIPIMLILLITDLTMGLVARTVPQLNIMILGLPIKILIGLLAFSLALPIFMNIIIANFQTIPNFIKNMYKVAPFLIVFAAEDKTEDATPRKKYEARRKGQVAKSKDVALALTLLASTIVLIALGGYAINEFKATMIAFLNNYLTTALTYNSVQNIMIIAVWRIAVVLLPMILPIMLMGVLANLLQTGFLISSEPIKMDFSKLNPINGFKRMFSVKTGVELIKDLALVTIVGLVGYNFISSNYTTILNLWNLNPIGMLSAIGNLTVTIFFRVTLLMIVIAISDYIFQWFQYNKDLRMTKQEVKEEYKQDEGDPQIKSKIKQKQREMAMRRMMQEVPKATVVVTNPTHISIAIKYVKGEEAPTVTAKGADNVALKIKQVAKENDIPIIENKPLARLMFEKVELDQQIPAEMYQAVAEILAVVFKLRK
jgi:flagellar biosynthesis protein FliR/FlhB